MNNKILSELNISQLAEFSNSKSLEAILIPDGDFYLNEYTPKDDNIRFELTKFKGSVGQALFLKGKLYLIVDGRYRLAAKEQFCGDELIIVDYTKEIWPTVLSLLSNGPCHRIGVWEERTTINVVQTLKEHYEVVSCDQLFSTRFDKPSPKNIIEVKKVPIKLEKNEVFVTHQVDVVSRLLGIRTDSLNYMSSLPGLLFYSEDATHLFHPFKEISFESCKSLFSESLFNFEAVKNLNGKTFVVDPLVTNHKVFRLLEESFKDSKVSLRPNMASQYMSLKTDWEMTEFEKSFSSSDKAVWNTLKYLKENQSQKLSEVDLKEKIISEYRKEGAWNLSFHPICGFGANSAIIHYGEPSDKKYWEEGEFFLMDSGAYFDYGVATDTTRTIVKGMPSEKQIKCYSLVLRGLIRAMSAIFPDGTLGSQVDMLARDALFQEGLNYQHGTGHGVGVHVHESGYLINPFSAVGLRAGQVGSIEPGYYEEGWGGIRLENIVKVVPHSKYEGYLTFESLCYIPFEENLIDRALFTSKELEYLDQYQDLSKKRLGC